MDAYSTMGIEIIHFMMHNVSDIHEHKSMLRKAQHVPICLVLYAVKVRRHKP